MTVANTDYSMARLAKNTPWSLHEQTKYDPADPRNTSEYSASPYLILFPSNHDLGLPTLISDRSLGPVLDRIVHQVLLKVLLTKRILIKLTMYIILTIKYEEKRFIVWIHFKTT